MFIGYQKIDRWMQDSTAYDVTICYWLQPPPSLPRRGGTDTLGCLISNGLDTLGCLLSNGLDTLGYLISNGLPTNKSNLHLPYGGEREGADVCGWVI